MPVEKNRDFLIGSVSNMPGMYVHKDVKPLGVAVERRGEYFNYGRGNIKVMEYNVLPDSGWVEACHEKLSLFGATSVSRQSRSAQQRAL